MTDQTAPRPAPDDDLPINPGETLPERLRQDAANLARHITPGDLNERAYRWRVNQDRADADYVAALQSEKAAAEAALAKLREPIADTYACERCGRKDGLDAVLPNHVWEQISEGGRWRLLCLWCMDERAFEEAITASVSLHFVGRMLHGTSQSDADRDHIRRLVEQREAAEATVQELRAENTRIEAEFDLKLDQLAKADQALVGKLRRKWEAAEARCESLQREIDEACMLTEGCSSLKQLAGAVVELTARTAEAEAEREAALADRINREARRREILEWLEEQTGTGWECECGVNMYNATAPFCHDCGREAPLLHQIAFKLHASHTDNAELIKRVATEWGASLKPSPEDQHDQD